mmetsp:Transcript_19920/g.57117  ORF Transcript_19920/g.57117 Transcript_19920/m.57117 type:complete len:305 (-) Transcript_19920:842-1756(-)
MLRVRQAMLATPRLRKTRRPRHRPAAHPCEVFRAGRSVCVGGRLCGSPHGDAAGEERDVDEDDALQVGLGEDDLLPVAHDLDRPQVHQLVDEHVLETHLRVDQLVAEPCLEKVRVSLSELVELEGDSCGDANVHVVVERRREQLTLLVVIRGDLPSVEHCEPRRQDFLEHLLDVAVKRGPPAQHTRQVVASAQRQHRDGDVPLGRVAVELEHLVHHPANRPVTTTDNDLELVGVGQRLELQQCPLRAALRLDVDHLDWVEEPEKFAEQRRAQLATTFRVDKHEHRCDRGRHGARVDLPHVGLGR